MFILDSVTLADKSVGKTQSEYLPYPFEQRTLCPLSRRTDWRSSAVFRSGEWIHLRISGKSHNESKWSTKGLLKECKPKHCLIPTLSLDRRHNPAMGNVFASFCRAHENRQSTSIVRRDVNFTHFVLEEGRNGRAYSVLSEGEGEN